MPLRLLIIAAFGASFCHAIDFLPTGVEIRSQEPSPIDGFETLHLNTGETIHVHVSSGHFFSGDMFHGDVFEGIVNLSEQSRANTRKTTFTQDLDTIDYGDGSTPVWVFTDPTCGYCQRLHLELDAIISQGIQVKYLAFPRGGPSSDTATSLAKAWCSNNPQHTLDALIGEGREPNNEGGPCLDRVRDHFELGQRFGVRGTPAVFTNNGQHIGGYLEPQAFVEQTRIFSEPSLTATDNASQ